VELQDNEAVRQNFDSQMNGLEIFRGQLLSCNST
jgi:hypothetical protein